MGCTQSTSNEVKDVNDITDEIKVFQTSGTHQYSKNRSILTDDGAVWKSSSAFNTFIIFDCGKYEISRIYIEFAKQSKPENIKLRLSEVGNAYSFRSSPPLKTWQLETDLISKEIPWQDVDYKVNLLMNDHENINIYQNGFKRYLRLDFNKWVTNISICRFFGKLSNRIPENSYQFDPILDAHLNQKDDTNEEKTESKYNDDNKEPYAPKIIDQSPAAKDFENGIIDNIWDDDMYSGWVMDIKEQIAYIIIDLGNNKVNEIYLRTYLQFRCKLCRILTADNPTKKSRKWDSLNEDNDFDAAVKLEEGVIYDIRDKHKKYIKLEFEKYSGSDCRNYYGLQRLKLFGDSDFLEKNIQFTMDDIKNMEHIDEDLVHEYREQEHKKVAAKMSIYTTQIQSIEQDEKTGKLSDEWMVAKKEYYNEQTKFYYMFTELYAYQSQTIYEQEQMIKIMGMQKHIAKEESKKILDEEIEYTKEDKMREEEVKKAKEEWQKANKDKTINAIDKRKLRQIWQALVKSKQEKSSEYYSEFGKKFTEMSNKCYAMYSNEKDAKVYECWKEALENHPLQISNLYNVQEYQQMFRYARKKDPDGVKKSLGKLADLFDKSLEQEKQLLHKFFVFQLSGNYWEARTQSFGRPPVTVLFDCGHEYRRKVNRLEFKISKPCNINKIVVSSAGELREEKMDSKDTDDDETHYDWNNFNFINELILDDKLKSEKKKKKK
eukprot:214826_1